METKEIELSLIGVSSSNTRRDLSAGTEDMNIEDLANSIQEQGLLNPIIVRKISDNQYDLIAGQRRFLACIRLGMKTISATVRNDLDDVDATVISLIENVHRAEMGPIDKAKAYQAIRAKYEDDKQVAKVTGVSISTVRRYLKLLNLTPSIQGTLTTAEGPAGVGTLSKLADFAVEDQETILEQIGEFKQGVQQEILRRSGGDVSRIPELVDQAVEDLGYFVGKVCKEGLCFALPEEFKDQLKQYLKRLNDEIDLEDYQLEIEIKELST